MNWEFCVVRKFCVILSKNAKIKRKVRVKKRQTKFKPSFFLWNGDNFLKFFQITVEKACIT